VGSDDDSDDENESESGNIENDESELVLDSEQE
jgi:hypothetical protein